MGKRRADDFPRTSRNLRKYRWMPRLELHGLQQLTVLAHVVVLHGARGRREPRPRERAEHITAGVPPETGRAADGAGRA